MNQQGSTAYDQRRMAGKDLLTRASELRGNLSKIAAFWFGGRSAPVMPATLIDTAARRVLAK